MNTRGLGAAGRYLAVGFEFAAAIVAGLFVGYYVDEYLGTSPAFLALLTIAALVGIVYRLLWMLRHEPPRA